MGLLSIKLWFLLRTFAKKKVEKKKKKITRLFSKSKSVCGQRLYHPKCNKFGHDTNQGGAVCIICLIVLCLENLRSRSNVHDVENKQTTFFLDFALFISIRHSNTRGKAI